MKRIHLELPGHWDSEMVAGSDAIHRCVGIAAGFGFGLSVVVEGSSIGRAAVGVAKETVVLDAVSIAESGYSLLAVAETGNYFQSVGTAVVHTVFVCPAVAEV